MVTNIVGINSAWLTFRGRADHAGTTPAGARHDAAQGASAFALAAHEIVAIHPGCTVNIGEMRFSPGAFNIVPERVTLGLEFRAPDPAGMERLENALLERAEREALRLGLELAVERLPGVAPAVMDAGVGAAFAAAAEELGLSHLPLVSFAGHDGQALAEVCPAGMIFVPSAGGASHSAREFTRWEDCVNGANVLLQAALRFASSLGPGSGRVQSPHNPSFRGSSRGISWLGDGRLFVTPLLRET